ncbi:MAG: hypothetical protein CO093_03130 [Alphaproteobacteria bacterium CG_4_9_14_3_um_filter_47_13]|nr:MAG: hypothetical protein CO093_03130 [Alphaproteobacteria bacterium CG_4_9_14_3_um_filter_47_13]
MILGAGASGYLRTKGPVAQAIAPLIGGYAGREIGGALGEAAAANNGVCTRTVTTDNLGRKTVVDSSACRQQQNMPAGTPDVQYNNP